MHWFKIPELRSTDVVTKPKPKGLVWENSVCVDFART